MSQFQPTRRGFIQVIAGGFSFLGLLHYTQCKQKMVTLYTFGDSILDCGRYNKEGVHPGQLLVHNDDRLFPEFQGQDLQSRGATRLAHRARDGATVADLESQAQGLHVEERVMVAESLRSMVVEHTAFGIALITIGGNDLLRGLIHDSGEGIAAFANALDEFVQQLPIRPVLLGNVYDPTFGDDRRNFLGIDPKVSRKNLQRVNAVIGKVANRYGQIVDLHAHFLTGDPSWFTVTIEPSLRGASEVRRAFLPYVLGKV